MTGALVASIFMVVVSLGDYQEFLYAAIGGWVVVSAATLITSL